MGGWYVCAPPFAFVRHPFLWVSPREDEVRRRFPRTSDSVLRHGVFRSPRALRSRGGDGARPSCRVTRDCVRVVRCATSLLVFLRPCGTLNRRISVPLFGPAWALRGWRTVSDADPHPFATAAPASSSSVHAVIVSSGKRLSCSRRSNMIPACLDAQHHSSSVLISSQ